MDPKMIAAAIAQNPNPSPNFNVYVGADAVAGAVVPVLVKDFRINPRSGR
jgi:hypothetical protein